MAYFILTETDLVSQLKADYPNGNIIYREDYQKSFKKEVRWNDAKKFLRKYPIFSRDCLLVREGIGEFYPSYTNSEKERFVCRPSRTQSILDGYDPKMQAIKLTDVFGIVENLGISIRVQSPARRLRYKKEYHFALGVEYSTVT